MSPFFKPISLHSCRLSVVTLALSISGMSAAAQTPLPPKGQKLLVVGQDNDSVKAYVKAMGEVPGGVTVYTNIMTDGLLSQASMTDAGPANVTAMAKKYPNSVLVVGLWMVGYLDAINAGDYDQQITLLINTFKDFKRPVYLRFGFEFDGSWNAYDPSAYKKAWKRFYDRVGELDARDNVFMVWQSSSYCSDGKITTYNNKGLADWWPGDSYVDVVALSYFTPGNTENGRRGTCDVANQAIDRVAKFAKDKGKPLMVAEATPQGYDIKNLTWRSTNGAASTPGPVKVDVKKIQNWYKDFFNWVDDNDVRIVAYINANWNTQPAWGKDDQGSYPNGYWGDSRVQANATIKAGWKEYVSGYLKASNSLFSILGYQGESAAVFESATERDD